LADLRKGIPIAQKLATTQADPKYKDLLAGLYWKSGGVLLETHDYANAADSFRKSASIREPIASAENSNPFYRTHFVGDYVGLATALRSTGDVNQAFDASKKGLDIIVALCHSYPANATLREYLGEAYDLSGPLLESKGNVSLALEYHRNAHKIFTDLKAADPANSLARANFGFSDIGIAHDLLLKHETQAAIPPIREAIATFEAIERKNKYDSEGLAEAYETLGMAYAALAEHELSHPRKVKYLRDSRSWLQQSLRTWAEVPRYSPSPSVTGNEDDRARDELAKCESELAKL
jgi:tetratricopeptide (TPR) repeat protein